ncbi:MAG: peptide deformylase [bacterium]
MARKNTPVIEHKHEIEIVQQGNPVLRAKAREITKEEFGTSALLKTVADMKSALDSQVDGVALAAPQIGLPLRIFVIAPKAFKIAKKEKLSREEKNNPDIKIAKMESDQLVYINPAFIKLSKKKKPMEEGCLSVRRFYGTVPRSDRATIEAYDEQGRKFTRGAGGLLAQIFQHETDHLNGTLFIDKADTLQEVTREEYDKIQIELAEENKQYE